MFSNKGTAKERKLISSLKACSSVCICICRLGLGAKVPRRSQVGPLNDPIERRLHKKLSVGRKKSDRDEESVPSSKNEIEHVDEDDEENLDSRTNAFSKKRTSALTTTPKQNKKPNLHN